MQILLLFLLLVFFFEYKMFGVNHLKLSVEIVIKDTEDILIHFKIPKMMIIESTCLKLKDLYLYIVETACKFIQFSLFFFEYKDYYIIKH